MTLGTHLIPLKTLERKLNGKELTGRTEVYQKKKNHSEEGSQMLQSLRQRHDKDKQQE